MPEYKIKTLYYPGAGYDFSTIQYFVQNTGVEKFYYCDYLNNQFRPENILEELKYQLPLYEIKHIVDLKPEYFNKSRWSDYWCSESDGQTFSGKKENSFISMYQIKFLDKICELYYFGTEAIETYRVLLENKIMVKINLTIKVIILI
jgi:hypothetical protein